MTKGLAWTSIGQNVGMLEWPKKRKAPPDASAVMGRVIILKNLLVKGIATVPHGYLATCKERWTKGEWTEFLDGERKQNMQAIVRLRQSGLWNAMEQEERSLIQASSTEFTRQMLVDARWSVESIVCLLWALGYISELLPYDQQADTELTNRLPKEAAQVLMKRAVLRCFGTAG